MFCNKCSEKIPDDSIFCPKCGQKVETGDVNDRVQKGKEILANWGAIHTLEDYELALEAMGYHSEGDNCIIGIKQDIFDRERYSYETYIVNERKDDIVIILCNKITTIPKFEYAQIIPKSEITHIKVREFINYGIVIYRNGKTLLKLTVPGTVKDRQRKMLRDFVSHYPHSGAEIVQDNETANLKLTLAWGIFAVAVIFLIVMGIKVTFLGDIRGIIAIILAIFLGGFTYYAAIKVKSKEKGE